MSDIINIADKTEMPRVFTQPPEQLHPGQIDFAKYGNNPALKRASNCLGFAWDGLASINEHRATPNPEDKPATHARKVRQNVDGFDHAWADRWDGAKADLILEQRRVEGELERAANLKPVAHHFDAITSTFHNMNPGQKANALDQLIEEGDGPALAALIEAPLFVSGLSAEQRDSIRLRVFRKVDPAGLALRDQLAMALVKMEAASLAAINARAKLREGTDRFEKRAKEAEDVAHKARSGFAS